MTQEVQRGIKRFFCYANSNKFRPHPTGDILFEMGGRSEQGYNKN